jgi:hypothetical protein
LKGLSSKIGLVQNDCSFCAQLVEDLKGLSLFCWVEANVQLDVKEHFDFA